MFESSHAADMQRRTTRRLSRAIIKPKPAVDRERALAPRESREACWRPAPLLQDQRHAVTVFGHEGGEARWVFWSPFGPPGLGIGLRGQDLNL
jgi:hypothetical protein